MFNKFVCIPISNVLLNILNWLLDRCVWSAPIDHALMECHRVVGRFWMKRAHPGAYRLLRHAELTPTPPYRFGPFRNEPEPLQEPPKWWLSPEHPNYW